MTGFEDCFRRIDCCSSTSFTSFTAIDRLMMLRFPFISCLFAVSRFFAVANRTSSEDG